MYINASLIVWFVWLWTNILCVAANNDHEIDIVPVADPKGYVAYCPCMGMYDDACICCWHLNFIWIGFVSFDLGRFGNQVDHFLGALRFAATIDRTLILPAWIEYRQGAVRSVQVPFDTYFQVQPLLKFHRVITMERFMRHLADDLWPKSDRVSLCYSERKSLHGGTARSCYAKEGNPFGPFWDEYHIDFVSSEFFSPLTYDTVNSRDMPQRWLNKYPPTEWPVLAFTGAPATFPVQSHNVELQRYLMWASSMQTAATNWIRKNMPRAAFIGIHLRNGIDWERACTHIKDSPNLFSAPQCLGYRNELGKANTDMCLPSKELVLKQLRRQIKRFNEANESNAIRAIFVASDNKHLINELNDGLKRLRVTAHKLDENNPHLDMAILEQSNLFIGNCISSYTAFVKRARDVRGFPSQFWAFPRDLYSSNERKQRKDELWSDWNGSDYHRRLAL